MIGQAADGGGGVPEGAASVQVPLVLLQLLQVLQERDAVTHDVEPHVLQVAAGWEREHVCQLQPKEKEQFIA